MGMSMIGVIHHSDAWMLIVSDQILYKKIESILDQLPKLEKVYTLDEISGIPNWMEVVEMGKLNQSKWESQQEAIKSTISPKDCASLIYTSGTTGTPKGVMLSHENLVQNFLAAAKVFQLTPEQRYLSILPLCHVGGRLGNYQTQYSGTSIYYAENMGTIAADMKEIRPHGFDAVPRILEKIYEPIISKGKKLTGVKKRFSSYRMVNM
jgi:long-chain acyl-CoA synthetase